MKTRILPIILATVMCISLAACGRTAENVTTDSSNSATSVSSDDFRTITDLAGNKIQIPAVSEIQRVVIISPPVMSFVLETIPDTEMIVGINPRAFTTSNTEIVNKVFPNWQTVNTSFIDASFSVNAESLLALKPDIIFYYGNIQKQGLGEISIPSLDFRSAQNDPEAVSIEWGNLLREIFGLDSSGSLQVEWERTNETLSSLLKNQSDKKTALCIFSNAAGNITVSGTDSFDAYAQSFFEKAGIENVAADIEGTAEVSIEQIYEWNPDMIFIFLDAPAQNILNNSIDGQDWSLLDAWKNGLIY